MSIYLYLRSCYILTGIDQPFSKQGKKSNNTKLCRENITHASSRWCYDLPYFTEVFFPIFNCFTTHVMSSFHIPSAAFQTTSATENLSKPLYNAKESKMSQTSSLQRVLVSWKPSRRQFWRRQTAEAGIIVLSACSVHSSEVLPLLLLPLAVTPKESFATMQIYATMQ